MSGFLRIAGTEAKLLVREPALLGFTLLLPLALLLVFGLPASGSGGEGERPIELLPAMSLSIAFAMLSLYSLPSALADYRSKGILRRLSTTPMRPVLLLFAQLVVNLLVALVAVGLVIVVCATVLDVGTPANLPGLLVALVLGVSSMFTIGLVVAAVAPSAQHASAIGSVLTFPMIFFAGLWLPRESMPDWLASFSEYVPLSMVLDSILDTWSGAAPSIVQLVAMAAITMVLGLVAARLFRWE